MGSDGAFHKAIYKYVSPYYKSISKYSSPDHTSCISKKS